jgi:2,3-bisphosphoglycerate-dependent phosphoglycerate mutase
MTDVTTTLLLVRHGQARAEDGSYGADTSLSELGVRQSEALADGLSGDAAPTTVYSSPFPRAAQTAGPLCDRLGLVARLDERLGEFEFGVTTVSAMGQRPDLLFWRPEQSGIDGGETLGAFAIRVAELLDELVSRHAGERVAVVSHAGVIDASLRWAVGLGPDTLWQHEFEIDNCSIAELQVWNGGRVNGGSPRYVSVRRVGDVAHLGELVSEV